MFSSTPSTLVFINQLGPCRFHSWKPTNQNLNKCLMKVKEKAKLTTYYGFNIQRMPDREAIYSPLGGPNKGRHYVRQSKTAKNYEHHNTREGKVGVHHHQRFKSPHNTISGITLWIWTGQWGVNEPGWGYSNFGVNHQGDRDSTVRNLDQWGLKVVNIDDRTAPRVENLMPHRHKLYAHNFPWIKEPVTNHKYGDADYYWKFEDKIDYTNSVTSSNSSYDYSIMANSEQAVAAARGQYVAPTIISSSSASSSSSTSAAAAAAAPEKKAEKKVEEKKAAAAPAAAEEKKAAAPAAAEKKVEETKAAPAPAAEEKKTTKKSSKKDKDDE